MVFLFPSLAARLATPHGSGIIERQAMGRREDFFEDSLRKPLTKRCRVWHNSAINVNRGLVRAALLAGTCVLWQQ